MIYLDNNATTRLAPEVREAILPFLDETWGNASSQNAPGQRAKEAIFGARRTVAEALHASPAEVIFTSGATESNHAAILGTLAHFAGTRRHIVASTVEHPSTLKLLQSLEQQGVCVTLIGVDERGMLDFDALDAAISHDTALVSLIWANNETGVVFQVEEAAHLAKLHGALFHTDAVQAIGRLPFDWSNSRIDLLSFSGHKLHAPKGIGALLQRKGLHLPPLLYGSQERNRRGGTENMIGIAGLGAAMRLLDMKDQGYLRTLRDQFEQHLVAALPFARIHGKDAPRVANTSSIGFGELNGEALMIQLERNGIIASLGSACASGGKQASHVLSAMGLPNAQVHASLRFSLSRYTTGNEVEEAATAIISVARTHLLKQPLISA